MSQRYLNSEKEMHRLIHDQMTADELAREMKIYYNFVPTDEILGQLTKRMIQFSNPKNANLDIAKELWSGFHPVYIDQILSKGKEIKLRIIQMHYLSPMWSTKT